MCSLPVLVLNDSAKCFTSQPQIKHHTQEPPEASPLNQDKPIQALDEGLDSMSDAQDRVGILDAVAWGGWAVGFMVQCAADWEKFRFRGDPANRNEFICSGLWYVRNYM